MKKNVILFDLDGTVMDSNGIILRSWQHTFRTILGHEGDAKEILATFGEPLKETMRKFFGGNDEDVLRNVDIYRSYQKEHMDEEIELFPGVYDMLAAAKDAGYRMAIVTSRLSLSAHDAIKSFGIGDFFEYILTGDDVTKHKPDPEPILITLENMGADPGQAVMVGDTKMDILCAKNAGTVSVLVDWSAAIPSGEAKDDYIPDYILRKPEDLLSLMKKINEE